MPQKLVVVLGATGTQGSSVVTALLKHGGYAIRAVTRHPNAPAAKALHDKGVDVVPGNLADKETLIKAFEGAYTVFGVTIPFTHDSEELQGRNIVDAAKTVNVPLLVWSSLPSAREASNGKHTNVVHFDEKSVVDKYIPTTGQPTVILHTGTFAENLLNMKQLLPDPNDSNNWNVVFPILRPEARLPGIWISADLGNMVVAVIDHWEDQSWKQRLAKEPIVAAPYEFSAQEVVDALTKVTGKNVSYVQRSGIPEQSWEKAVFGAFSFANDGFYNYSNNCDAVWKELGVETHSFEDYAREVLAPYVQSTQ